MNETPNPPQTCPNCGAVLEDNPPYCPSCGASLLPATAPAGVGIARTCLGVFLLLCALPLGAFGGCMALLGVGGGTSFIGTGGSAASFFATLAVVLAVAALLFVGAIKCFKK